MTDEELKQLFESMRQENSAAHVETRNQFARIDTRFATLENKVESTAAETRRHFDVAVERIEKRFDLLTETVQHLDEKIDRRTVDLEEKIERTAAETQAMIKFSHVELDRRVRALEEGVADLQARVERLESSTH